MISYRRVQKESDELLYTVWSLVMVRHQLLLKWRPSDRHMIILHKINYIIILILITLYLLLHITQLITLYNKHCVILLILLNCRQIFAVTPLINMIFTEREIDISTSFEFCRVIDSDSQSLCVEHVKTTALITIKEGD